MNQTSTGHVILPLLFITTKMLSSDFQALHECTFKSKEDVLDAVQRLGRENGHAFSIKDSRKDKHVTIACVHAGKRRNDYKKKTKEEGGRENALSQRRECPWVLKARYDRVKDRWIVMAINDDHNHDPARDVRVYAQHRKLSDHALRDAAAMIEAGASNRTIVRKLGAENAPLLSKDISNLRPKLAGNLVDVQDLIERLQSSGHSVRWHVNQESELDRLFFSHQHSKSKAQKFPEVVIMDATYSTNTLKMPFVNIVGVSNLGQTKLRSFAMAGAWVTREDEESMTWVTLALKELVFDSGVYPSTFVTDNQLTINSAIDRLFPDAKRLLCTWHIKNNFKTTLRKLFSDDEKWEALAGAVDKLIHCHNQEQYESAINSYQKATLACSKPKTAQEYLDL
jgi:MULE transposase domain